MTHKLNYRFKLNTENIFTIVAPREAMPGRKAKLRGVPTKLQPNGVSRQNHSWLSTLVTMTTQEAPTTELLWKKNGGKKRVDF